MDDLEHGILLTAEDPEPGPWSVVIDYKGVPWTRQGGTCAWWRTPGRWAEKDWPGVCSPGAVALVGGVTEYRRADAARNPARWRIGQSPGTDSLTIYSGARIAALATTADNALFLVAAANEYQKRVMAVVAAGGDPVDEVIRATGSSGIICSATPMTFVRVEQPAAEQMPAGEQLDAERRGTCAHHMAWYVDEESGVYRCAGCGAPRPGQSAGKGRPPTSESGVSPNPDGSR